MDVRCTKCGTEYEFDDAKVKPTGVAVQCTSCGHVFKVQRDSGAIPEPIRAPDAEEQRDWMVRTADETTLRFKELTTLQKWIVEQRVSPSDEISKTGKTWKRLGDISELSSFFEVVEAAKRAARPQIDQAGLVPPATADEDLPVMQPAELTRGKPTPNTGEVANPAGIIVLDDDPEAHIETQALPRATAHEREPQPPPVAQVEQPEDDLAFISSEFGKATPELDDDDPVLQWQKKGRRKKIFIAAALLLLLAPVVLFFAHRPTFDKALGPVAAPLIDALGLTDYGKPPPTVPDPGPVLRAANPEDLAAALKSLPNHEVALAARAALLAERAWIAVETARLSSSDSAPALKDAYDALQLARASKRVRPDEVARAAAIYAAARGNVDEVSDDVLKARAKLVNAGTDLEQIKALDLDALDVSDPRAAYLALVKRAAAPDDVQQVKADLATFAAARPGHPASLVKPSESPVEVTRETPREKPKDDLESLDLAALLKKGQRAARAGNAWGAIKIFRTATKKDRRSAVAWTGLGWGYLDVDKPGRALGAFSSAVALDQNSPEAQLGLAESLRYTGKKPEAINAYKRYLKLAPNGRESQMARNAIKALGG